MRRAEETKIQNPQIIETMERYRSQLLEAGFREPTKHTFSTLSGEFYQQVTELTAFIVNLHGYENHVEIVYGFASTAFTRMAGCEMELIESGVSDEAITIRQKVPIYSEEDEISAGTSIQTMYEQYRFTEKEDLLAARKEKQKQFIGSIAGCLKPLGFKKKNLTWTKTLTEDYYLMFNAQKSNFSDEYYFNVYIGKNGTNHYGDCYYNRIFPENMCPMDWQCISQEKWLDFLENGIKPELQRLMETPICQLGKERG